MTTAIDIDADELVRYYRSIGIECHVASEMEVAQVVSRDADLQEAKNDGKMQKAGPEAKNDGTKKQAGKMKKGSPEAKAHMAKLRSKRGKAKPAESEDNGD